MIETRVVKNNWEAEKVPHLMTHETTMPSLEARFAMSLIERWGLVAAAPDGEDSAGRAKLRSLTPAETVHKAIESAECAMSEFRRRGWLVEMPTIAEIDAMAKEAVAEPA